MKLYPVYCDCTGERKEFTRCIAAVKAACCPKCGKWCRPEVPRECSE